MSSSLLKLLDSSLLPASAMILAKIIGLWLVIMFWGIDWQMNFVGHNIVSVYPVVFQKDLFLVSSVSDFVLIILMNLVYSRYVLHSLYLHDSHVDPILIARLAHLNLLGVIRGTFELFSNALAWGIFCMIANITVLLNVLNGKTSIYVLFIGIFISIILSVIMIRDAEGEIQKSTRNLSF